MGPVEQIQEWWSRVRGCYPVRIDGKEFCCDPEHISFWSRVSSGRWEPETFNILDRLIRPGSVYCDIGAWIGPTVLHSAARCSKVYCFEPDRTAFMYLLRNIRLNKLENVLPFNIALAAENGIKRMASPRGKRGDSMTSLLLPNRDSAIEVLCFTWHYWYDLVGKPEIDCLKMDVEGGEFTLLPSMKEYLEARQPGVYLSLHPHLLDEGVREREMMRIVEALACYRHYVARDGSKRKIESLLEGDSLHKPSSCLLLPV